MRSAGSRSGKNHYSRVPDIGILASRDPGAIDAASFDLVSRRDGLTNCLLKRYFGKGEDKFRGMRRNTDGFRQIRYAGEIGLGPASYRLLGIG